MGTNSHKFGEESLLVTKKECLERTHEITKRHTLITSTFLETFYALIWNHIISVDREREMACKRLVVLCSWLNLKC